MWGWQGSKSNLLRFGVSVVMAETSSALVLWHWEMSLACAHGCTSHSHQQSTLCCTGQLPECSHLLKDTHCCVPGVFYPAACITIFDTATQKEITHFFSITIHLFCPFENPQLFHEHSLHISHCKYGLSHTALQREHIPWLKELKPSLP